MLLIVQKDILRTANMLGARHWIYMRVHFVELEINTNKLKENCVKFLIITVEVHTRIWATFPQS